MLGAIDLGGTQVRVGVGGNGEPGLRSSRAVTASLGGPEGFVGWAAESLRRLGRGERLRGVGVAAPGPLDPSRGVLLNPPNLPGWRHNLPLADLLGEGLGVPVWVENDANLAALAEHRRGAGVGTRNLVYVTWSTGIGSGLILDGRLYGGSHGTAGEIGHTVLDPDGPDCLCGQRGCLEAYACGNALARASGRPAVQIFSAAAHGEPGAQLIVSTAASRMGLALVNLINLVDPEMIVIGGGITRSWSLVRPVIDEIIRSSPFIRPARRPRLLRTRLGDRVSLIGALEWARLRGGIAE